MRKRNLTRRVSWVLAVVMGLSAVWVSAAAASQRPQRGDHASPKAEFIDNSYIVVFKEAPGERSLTSTTAATFAARYGAKVRQTYRHALNGFAGEFDAAAAKRIAADPAVAYVTQDRRVSVDGTQVSPPSWGLDRVDQRDLPLDNTYSYPANTAATVTAYIIDTGIRTTHQEFGTRAQWGTNTSGDGDNTDCNGHGTHVAGTVGGTTHGVAKGVKLVAVKVLPCTGTGTNSAVIAGIDWVTANHVSGPAVANVSLGGPGPDQALEDAVRRSIADGVVYALSAGNDTEDACNHTPGRTPEGVTVASVDDTDRTSDFSDYGPCVDIYAPGEGITSAWNTGDTATEILDGTSMATPHVTGALALLVAAEPTLTPARAAEALYLDAGANRVIANRTGTPNRLLATNTGNRPGYPVVTNPGFRAAKIGTPFSLPNTAAGGTAPYTWTASGLPAGLTINAATGLISGNPTTQATAAVTVTATDAAGRARGASFTIVVTVATGGCGATGQKLINPGFESGTSGWIGDTQTIGAWTGDRAPRAGTRAAVLNGLGVDSDDTINQAVTIPAACVHSTLSFYLRVVTEETDPIRYDRLTVSVGSTILATYDNTNASAAYALKSFPVGAFAGQTLIVSFHGIEDFAAGTKFLLDDLALTAA
ncbi:S8 family serine peptidase [Actinokineospora sp. NBRC 105648]|uniref:S8 family serine peptidase n=1 Tax=Actinokineospora sp. NBRC 105648 TaxID=3032206 RepID=UPI002555BADB|nr:S8 family serine peptidase [Actinokineospora sp. NBRC 105648]